jgi:H+/Cl- antiporter ClcA
MPFHWNYREHLELSRYVLRWLLIATPIAAIIGVAVALFLAALDWATRTRLAHPWLLYLLPVAGIGVGAMYHYLGKTAEAGNNLIIDQIHKPGGGVPRRMAPLILVGTVVTHLFGGSAGREGTAVQMGGSIASGFCRLLKLKQADIRTLLMCGVAAGFGAVFGTPLTGAVFAMEVLSIGRMDYRAALPCLIAAISGDFVCDKILWHWFHLQHQPYRIAVASAPHFDAILLGKVIVASAFFGLASVAFAELTHGLAHVFKKFVPWPVARPALGGVIVVALTLLIGRTDYLGLGVKTPGAVCIVSAFEPGGAGIFSFGWKILFTAVTLGSGFKGGEVTPLFFVGATLGNTMSRVLSAPTDLMAGLGFVAVFAGATNTPLACTIMGIELFGAGPVVYLATACFLAYLFSGHTGIYLSQHIGAAKTGRPTKAVSLRDARTLAYEDPGDIDPESPEEEGPDPLKTDSLKA